MSKLTERGQALILIAFAAIGLFAFAALAIDGSRQFSNKRNAQNAADTAVLAAALTQVRTGSFTAAATAALDRAKSNGYDDLAPETVVMVNLCSDAGVTCEGLPTTAVKSEYIRVRIVTEIPTTFARVLGRNTMQSAAEAIAHVQGSSSPSTGSSFNGAAMVATKGGNYDQCFLMNGGADLYTHDSGIYVNCSGSQAGFMNGGATLDMDVNGQIVGCYAYNGGAVFDPITCGVNGGVSQIFDASTFASVPTMPTPPSSNCSSPGGQSGGTMTPGYFPNSVTVIQNTTMDSGTYCFRSGFNVTGTSTLSGPAGTVTIVMEDSGTSFNLGNSNFTFNDLEIFTIDGSFQVNGTGVLTANRLRFYSSGSGTFTINGNGGVSSDNAYIYLHRGYPSWNGGSIVDLHAAPQGDPEGVGGLMIHMPWENTSDVTINGGSTIDIVGTFLMPHSRVTFNGGTNFELHSQVIGYEYIVNGGGAIDIYYIAQENYQPPNLGNPAIQLTK